MITKVSFIDYVVTNKIFYEVLFCEVLSNDENNIMSTLDAKSTSDYIVASINQRSKGSSSGVFKKDAITTKDNHNEQQYSYEAVSSKIDTTVNIGGPPVQFFYLIQIN